LPADNEYRATWQEILDGVAAGRPPEAGHEGTGQVMPAIQAFVNADGWAATRAVVEAQRELLFRPEVEAIFEENIRNAQNGGDTRRAGVLQQHLDLLRACQRDGITAAFERLEEARRPPLPFDEELIPRTVGALRGSPAEKLAHFQHVTGLAASTTDPELKAFLGAIQMALVGGDLRASGEELKGVYAQAWGPSSWASPARGSAKCWGASPAIRWPSWDLPPIAARSGVRTWPKSATGPPPPATATLSH
jgi:hypothetical protein